VTHNWTPEDLAEQLAGIRSNGLIVHLQGAANKYRLPLAYVLAVASRETNMRNMLGDAGHGVGIIQIDIRYHDIAREMKADGTWKTRPERLIDYGVKMLADGIADAKAHWPNEDPLRVSADSYNAGAGNVRIALSHGHSPDAPTTGHNYGQDVLDRMAVLEKMLMPEPKPPLVTINGQPVDPDFCKRIPAPDGPLFIYVRAIEEAGVGTVDYDAGTGQTRITILQRP
jgi:hypothetical protein